MRPAPAAPFASNDLTFDDPTGVDHDALGAASRALYNYMHGIGLEAEAR